METYTWYKSNQQVRNERPIKNVPSMDCAATAINTSMYHTRTSYSYEYYTSYEHHTYIQHEYIIHTYFHTV